MLFATAINLLGQTGDGTGGAGKRWSLRRNAMCLASLCAIVALAVATSQAQDSPPPNTGMDYTLPFEDASGSANYQTEQKTVGGYGFRARAGHEAGNTVGREDSITYFDLGPYMFVDDTIFFGETRLFIANDGHAGGTAGGGFRHFFPNQNSIFGMSAYYDGDDSRGVMFNQLGVTGELLTEYLDVRTNVYLPYGETEKVTAVRFEQGSEQFIDRGPGLPGTNIAFQRRTFLAAAMKGLDMNFTAPVPYDWAQQINLEATAGWYHYQADDDNVPKVWGWKLRLDADIWERFSHMFLEVMHDKTFKTNVVFGIDVNYWHDLEFRPRVGHSQYGRLAEWVRRNRTVVAFDSSFLGDPELAINPTTNAPYIVYQVNSNAGPGGDGTLVNPFQFPQEAIDFGGADIVFAQGNSVFDGDVIGDANARVVLTDNLFVAGEGAGLTIPVVGLTDEVALPTVTPEPFARPIIRDVEGPAVTMANNSRFGGFDIINVNDGPAILATGINSAQIDSVNITTTTGLGANGIELTNNAGLFEINDVSIQDVNGDALFVSGGSANILFQGSNFIGDTNGFAVRVVDAAGAVNVGNTVIDSTGGLGIAVIGTGPGSSTANVTFDNVTLTDTNAGAPAPAFLISNHAGAVSVLGSLTIDNNNGDAFVVSNLQSTGTVSVQGTTTITDRAGAGIRIVDIAESGTQSGIVLFNGPVTINGLATGFVGTDAAIEFQTSSGTLDFTQNVSIDGSNGAGVNISNILDVGTTTGRFISERILSIADTDGTAFNVDQVAKSNYLVRTAGINIDDRNGVGINVSNYLGTAQFFGQNIINNQNDSTAIAINVINNTGTIGFANTTVNNQQGANSFGVRVFNNVNPNVNVQSVVSFATLNVESENATAVSFESNENVSVNGGIIDATGARGVEVLNNSQHNLTFTAVSATNSDFGIVVDNSPGQFHVIGTNNVIGTGGTISGMTTAGASFTNTQIADLRNMQFNGNNRGVVATNLLIRELGLIPGVNLQGVAINGSTNQGVFITDTQFVQLTNSIITNNGGGGTPQTPQIEILATQSTADLNLDGVDDPIIYDFRIINNNIADATGAAITGADMIFIHTATTIPDPARLDLIFTNNGTPPSGVNSVTSNRNGAAALGVTWEGQFNASINNNAFVLLDGNGVTNGDNQIGVRLNIDGISDVVFANNSLSAAGDNNTGLLWNFQQAAAVLVSNNQTINAQGNLVGNSGFSFTGANSTGMNFTFLAPNNDVIVQNNLIEFLGTAFDGTGILFSRIFGPSDVRVQGNTIALIGNQIGGLQRGIIFQDIRGVISLFNNPNFGNVDNVVTPVTLFVQPVFIPAGTTTGQIIVNGVPVP